MEKEQKDRPLSAAEAEAQVDELLARLGTTRTGVVEKHGSMGAFWHWYMCRDTGETKHEPQDGLTAQERYMAMLK